MSTFKVVMLRHGESEWNQRNLFCGWYDAKLSEKGKEEAATAGKVLKSAGYSFDIAFTSVLSRAQQTFQILANEIGQSDLPVVHNWRLNERHYGGLTGLNKAETAAKYGEEQVTIWRRSYDVPPPPMEVDHPYYDSIVNDHRYDNGPNKSDFPKFESLKMTLERTLPYWTGTIIPEIRKGQKVLIVAHGNSLRGIVKVLDQMNEEQIMKLNLPTGIPFVYTLDTSLKPMKPFEFLGDGEMVKKAMELVADQGKANTRK